jgi:uncharacterized protein YbjT (DUF2867 family)
MRVLVIGAAGDLGSRVAAALQAEGLAVRAFVRRPITGDDVVVGDLGSAESLAVACKDVDRMFLLSSPVPNQVELETNAIEAAESAGVARIVKVSNIPIPGLETGLHGNHRAIERRLDASPVDAVFVQPSFFTTVIERQREQIARGRFVMPTGDGRIAWIEPADIAAVAAAALTRDDVTGALHITGPEALSAADVAARLGAKHLDPPLDQWRDAAVAGGLDPWLADSTVHLYEAIKRGALAEVTTTVSDVLGRVPQQPFVQLPGSGAG